MSDEAREAVAFLQDLMVGKVTYDRMDPGHLRQMGAACQLVDDYAVVTGLLPELSQKLAGLKGKGGDDAAGLGNKKRLLEELAPGQTREGVVRSLRDFHARGNRHRVIAYA